MTMEVSVIQMWAFHILLFLLPGSLMSLDVHSPIYGYTFPVIPLTTVVSDPFRSDHIRLACSSVHGFIALLSMAEIWPTMKKPKQTREPPSLLRGSTGCIQSTISYVVHSLPVIKIHVINGSLSSMVGLEKRRLYLHTFIICLGTDRAYLPIETVFASMSWHYIYRNGQRSMVGESCHPLKRRRSTYSGTILV